MAGDLLRIQLISRWQRPIYLEKGAALESGHYGIIPCCGLSSLLASEELEHFPLYQKKRNSTCLGRSCLTLAASSRLHLTAPRVKMHIVQTIKRHSLLEIILPWIVKWYFCSCYSSIPPCSFMGDAEHYCIIFRGLNCVSQMLPLWERIRCWTLAQCSHSCLCICFALISKGKNVFLKTTVLRAISNLNLSFPTEAKHIVSMSSKSLFLFWSRYSLRNTY